MFIISIFTLYKFLQAYNIRTAFFHGLASGFAIGIRVIGILVPFFTILWFIFDYFINKKQKKEKDPETLRSIQYLLIYIFITIAILLVLMPTFLPDPAKHFMNSLKTMSDYPENHVNLYMGQYIDSLYNLPWHYLPVNIVIMTPILYTVLFLVGFSYFASRLRRNLAVFYSENKFIIMAALWFFIPVLTAILLGSNMYNGWRQMYFIYPAFLIIALNGVRFIYAFLFKKINLKSYNLASAVITALLIFNLVFITQLMVGLHPHQYVYYNIIAGKNSDEVKNRFTIDYWNLSLKDGFEYILENDDREKITYIIRPTRSEKYEDILPEQDEKRLVFVDNISEADYFLYNYKLSESKLEEAGLYIKSLENKIVHRLIVNNGEILTVYKLR